MPLQVVIKIGGTPGSNIKVTVNFTFLVLLSHTLNFPFCHEEGDGEPCKLNILLVVS